MTNFENFKEENKDLFKDMNKKQEEKAEELMNAFTAFWDVICKVKNNELEKQNDR